MERQNIPMGKRKNGPNAIGKVSGFVCWRIGSNEIHGRCRLTVGDHYRNGVVHEWMSELSSLIANKICYVLLPIIDTRLVATEYAGWC